MILKFTFVISCIGTLFSICSCTSGESNAQNNNGTLIVSGTLENANSAVLFFDALTSETVVPLDTITTDEDGNFEIFHNVEKIGFYRISSGKNNFVNLIISPGESVNFKADNTNLEGTYTVSGSNESQKLKDLNMFLRSLYATRDSLNQAMRVHQNNQDMNGYMGAVNVQNQMGQKVKVFVEGFVDLNEGMLVTMAAVRNVDLEQNIALFLKVKDGLNKTYPSSGYTKRLIQDIEKITRLSEGAMAPEISLPDTDGNLFSLSDLKGKVVLVDFWASWCKPCRAENPNVVKMYKQYNKKGFEILGVSLDKSKEAWVNAIKQDGLTWKHISDLGFWQSSVVPLYNVKGIPLTFLIDKEGKIIGKNLRGPSLEQKLKEIFE